MENDSPSCQLTNHQNSNEHRNTQELWKPVKHGAAINTRFLIFVAPSERNRTKNWSALWSMLASRKFLGSPLRLSNFQHRIKPMKTKTFQMKGKHTEICSIKDAENEHLFDSSIASFCWRWERENFNEAGRAMRFHCKIKYLDGLFDFGSPNWTLRVHLFMLKPIGQVKEVSWLYGFSSNLVLTGFILEMWIDLWGPWTWFEQNGQILERFGGSREIDMTEWIRFFFI
jgi:hypothetical protein